MATESWRTDPSVEQVLFDEGYEFDFFQAVRMLERLYAHRQPVGRDALPSQEVVRFRSHPSLSFPPSPIYEVTRAANDDEPPQMTVAFMGLTGLLGTLPHHYTELLMKRQRHKDGALHEFLDLFHHRLVSLFYRAWEKYRFATAYERAAVTDQGPDDFTMDLFSLLGLGTEGLRGHLEVEDEALVSYTGLLAQRPRSASALAALLRDYFGIPVQVQQFCGQWLSLPPEQRTRLGVGERNNVLGLTAVAGSRVWDQQARFRVQMGPLTFTEFQQFLPAGHAFRPLVQLIRFFAGLDRDFEVQLILKADDVPACRLGGPDDNAPRLGWSTWLKTGSYPHNADDTVLAGGLIRRDIARQESPTAAPEDGHGDRARADLVDGAGDLPDHLIHREQ